MKGEEKGKAFKAEGSEYINAVYQKYNVTEEVKKAFKRLEKAEGREQKEWSERGHSIQELSQPHTSRVS